MDTDSVLKHYETQLSKEKANYLGMSEVQRKKVEDVLLEGDLLEVTTDETTQIWQVCEWDVINWLVLTDIVIIWLLKPVLYFYALT